MRASTEFEIREALHRKKLNRLRAVPGTIIIDELGLSHAKVRVDVAVINGHIHGYEIKSAADSLNRLPFQLAVYRDCLEKLTIVCAGKHAPAVLEMSPSWCGIIVATRGRRGAISFKTVRLPRRNPNVSVPYLARLLWRAECLGLLMTRGVSGKYLKMSRAKLCDELGTIYTVAELTAIIRNFMSLRRNWRGLQVRA